MAVIHSSPDDVPLDFAQTGQSRSLWGDAWVRLRRNKLALFGIAVLLVLCVVAIAAPAIAPYPYDKTVRDPVTKKTVRNQPPSAEHWFGTDDQSRDEFSRVVYGSSISLSVGLVSQIIILGIGVPLGLIAGYYGGWIDMVLMRITDIMYAFPTVLFAVVILASLGPSLINIYLAIGFTFWPPMARLVRSQVLSLKEKEYVEAARSIGVPPARIMFAQILPNALGPIIVAATFGIPFAILIEAFLSFIGIGVPIPLPSWGAMIARGRDQIRSEPWLVLFPSVALALTLFAFNFFGDGLRDALDPRSRR
ncbi:MAG TPA: ABC transporter permease [Chloroflexia bacterium]|nr:ABC transporter permease [Chloroflexia bacterium]